MLPSGQKLTSSRPSGGPAEEIIRRGRLIVIGNFDGVHRGHQWVLSRAKEQAVSRQLQLSVLTFDPHPAAVLGGSRRAPLTRLSRKSEFMKSAALDLEVIVQPFDRELAALSPEEFAERILIKELGARAVLVGANFRFGAQRAGDLGTLIELGKKYGFDAWAEELRGDTEGAFSSTRVRYLLGQGEVEKAEEILGRPHRVAGRVVHGEKRGRTLGFPTANLAEITEALPKEGVYVVSVPHLGEEVLGVANVGARPTFGKSPAFEVHLLDFNDVIYDQVLDVSFRKHLRSVKKFDGVEALKRQIERDVACARAWAQGTQKLELPQ